MSKFDRYALSASPSFNETETREAFSHAVPLKTLVIYCYDPRAAEIPHAVAERFGNEVYPGQIMLDASAIAWHRPRPCSPSSLPEGAQSMRCAPSPSPSTCSGYRTS